MECAISHFAGGTINSGVHIGARSRLVVLFPNWQAVTMAGVVDSLAESPLVDMSRSPSPSRTPTLTDTGVRPIGLRGRAACVPRLVATATRRSGRRLIVMAKLRLAGRASLKT